MTTASRLEIAASVPFLQDILSSQNLCDGCKENTVLVFAEEDEETLQETFDRLCHFESGFQRKFSLFLRDRRERSPPTLRVERNCSGEKIYLILVLARYCSHLFRVEEEESKPGG